MGSVGARYSSKVPAASRNPGWRTFEIGVMRARPERRTLPGWCAAGGGERPNFHRACGNGGKLSALEFRDYGADLLLEAYRQGINVNGPCVAADSTRHRHDGETLDDERTAVVKALRAPERQRAVRVRHRRK